MATAAGRLKRAFEPAPSRYAPATARPDGNVSPPPAIVVTSPPAETRRIRCPAASATTIDLLRLSNATAIGYMNVARPAGPSLFPATPLPAIVFTRAFGTSAGA